MDQEKREQQVQAAFEHLKRENENNRSLYEYGRGDPNVPKPSRDHIERCVGPLKSDPQLRQEAEAKVSNFQQQQERDAQNRAEVEQSCREHQRHIEERETSQQGPRDGSYEQRLAERVARQGPAKQQEKTRGQSRTRGSDEMEQ